MGKIQIEKGLEIIISDLHKLKVTSRRDKTTTKLSFYEYAMLSLGKQWLKLKIDRPLKSKKV